jgi:hypothetical protein
MRQRATLAVWTYPNIGETTTSTTHGGDNVLRIEIDREDDGRWIAEIPELPGVMAYGATQKEARAKVEALALRAQAAGGVPVVGR